MSLFLWWVYFCDESISVMSLFLWWVYFCDECILVMSLFLWWVYVGDEYFCDECILVMSVFLWWVYFCDECILVMSLFLWWVYFGDESISVMSVFWWWVYFCDECISVMSLFLCSRVYNNAECIPVCFSSSTSGECTNSCSSTLGSWSSFTPRLTSNSSWSPSDRPTSTAYRSSPSAASIQTSTSRTQEVRPNVLVNFQISLKKWKLWWTFQYHVKYTGMPIFRGAAEIRIFAPKYWLSRFILTWGDSFWQLLGVLRILNS